MEIRRRRMRKEVVGCVQIVVGKNNFLVLLLLPSLVIFSNSPTLAFTTDRTPIFVLICLVIFIPSFKVTTGELMVDLGVVMVV